MAGFLRTYKNAKPEDVIEAFNYLKEGVRPDNVSDAVANLFDDMKRPVELLFGEAGALMRNGIHGNSWIKAMKRFGLDERIGFIFPQNATAKELDNWIKLLPFGKKPFEEGSDEFIKFSNRADDFAKSEMNPILAITRMMEAVQMVKFEKGLAENFAQRFGWKAMPNGANCANAALN
jgi:hypothetical protein